MFLINFLTFAAVFIALCADAHRRARPGSARRARARADARGPALRPRAGPDLQAILIAVFFVGTFGLNFQMTSALMATEVFDQDAGGYGLLGSIMAVGLAGGRAARRPPHGGHGCGS